MPTLDRSTTHPNPPHRRWLLAAVALAFACPGDDATPSGGSGSAGPTTTTTTTSTSTSTTTEPGSSTTAATTTADSTGTPPVGDCECAIADPFGDELDPTCDAAALASWVPGCPDAQPCPRLTVACPRPGVDLYDCTMEYTYDDAATQCMLETLRDGTPARLEIDGLEDPGLFGGQSRYMVHVLEGRMAVRAGCLRNDVGVLDFGPSLHTLAEPDYFTGCIALPTPSERYDCLMAGLQGDADVPPCGG
jgi:hypothetical protein